MQKYVALLRGVNVGGKSLLKMADLQQALAQSGLQQVRTYIQSGNVIFESPDTDTLALADHIRSVIQKQFSLQPDVVVFSREQWRDVVQSAPAWWGADADWKHNLLILIPPCTPNILMDAIGVLKPDLEAVQPGPGVVYQSILFEKFGQTTSGKLASSPLYKQMTIRNFNTTQKLLILLDS